MNFPCPTNPISCPGAGDLDFDSPLSNLSSERPDSLTFVGISWGTSDDPPLGSTWTATDCFATCESSVSQDAADTCAEEAATDCQLGGYYSPDYATTTSEPGPGGTAKPYSPHSPTRHNVPRFANQAQSCSVPCPGGTPFVATIPPGRYVRTTQALANAIAQSAACVVAHNQFLCLSSIPLSVCLHAAYSGPITVTGTANPITFDILLGGALPPGLSLTQTGPQTALISGTATAAGFYTFQVRATDNVNRTQVETYSINVLDIGPNPLPPGVTGTAYLQQLTFNGATYPVGFHVTSGAIPTGLTLYVGGLIAGTPSAAGTFNFTVQATDTDGLQCSQALSIVIAPATTGPDWTTMVWDIANAYGAPSASISAVQDTVSGALLSRTNPFPCDAKADLHGSLHYTGPAANCQLVFTVLNGSGNAPLVIPFVVVRILQNGGLEQDIIVSLVTVPGLVPQTLNFTIGAGVNVLVEVNGLSGPNEVASAIGLPPGVDASGFPQGHVVWSFKLQNAP